MAAEQRQFIDLVKEVSGGDEVQGRTRLFGVAHRVFVEDDVIIPAVDDFGRADGWIAFHLIARRVQRGRDEKEAAHFFRVGGGGKHRGVAAHAEAHQHDGFRLGGDKRGQARAAQFRVFAVGIVDAVGFVTGALGGARKVEDFFAVLRAATAVGEVDFHGFSMCWRFRGR